LNGLALCAGVGGLELGLRLAIGEDYKCVGYCEREAFAASVLVARMEEKALDQAPIWDDLESFPSDLYSEKVDIISAGFPCQPHSLAGQRRGIKDKRWLWPSIERIIRDVGPRFVFLENVPGLLAGPHGMGAVFGTLASLGFDAEWGVFSAAQVGASHKRERIFILAIAQGKQVGTSRQSWESPELADATKPRLERPRKQTGQSRQSPDELANAESDRRGERSASRVRRTAQSAGTRGQTLGDAKSLGIRSRGERFGVESKEPFPTSSSAIDQLANTKGMRRGAEPRTESERVLRFDTEERAFPPGPSDHEGWEDFLKQRPDLEPAIRRSSHGMAYRVDRLRSIGNGVVPLAAAYAFRTLAARIG